MDIRFFFEYDGTVVQLPVNPENLKVSTEINNSKETLVNLNEIIMLGAKKLSTVDIECFFPKDSSGYYVLTKGKFKSYDFYKQFFESVYSDQEPMRFVVSGTDINMLVGIDKFETEFQAGDPDLHYLLKLSEYKTFGIKTVNVSLPRPPQPVQPKSTSTSKKATSSSGGQITIGCNVIANGRVHRDSYGRAPGITVTNYRGKINFINKAGSHPYHLTTPSGGWLGWMLPNAVKRV